MVWVMVMWIATGGVTGTYSAAINTLPQRFASEARCEDSGKVLAEKTKGKIGYACVPVTAAN